MTREERAMELYALAKRGDLHFYECTAEHVDTDCDCGIADVIREAKREALLEVLAHWKGWGAEPGAANILADIKERADELG